jgi:hypothetical protein
MTKNYNIDSDLFFMLNTMPPNKEVQFVYIALDCTEGSCVGHWIWECALFLPAIKLLQTQLPHKIKILLNEPKLYKKNILSDFGFYESDIVYSNKLENFPINGGDNRKYIHPEESEYTLYLPNIHYLWITHKERRIFFDCLNSFRNYYIQQLPDITKSTKISCVVRSIKENYFINKREFVNKDEVYNMLEKKGVNIICTDYMTSFLPQFHEILKSKVIILEMGSVFTINVAFIASNSHIILLNDFWNYDNYNSCWMEVIKKLSSERNNTIERFPTEKAVGPDFKVGGHDFSIDTDKLEKRISEILLEENLQ